MEHMSDQETHLALKGTIERGGKFGHVDCPPVLMEGGLSYSQVLSLSFVYAPTQLHEVMQPDMCTNEVIVLQVL